jgi:hypothetical protein
MCIWAFLGLTKGKENQGLVLLGPFFQKAKYKIIHAKE